MKFKSGKYRLTLEDTSRLRRIWGVRTGRWRLLGAGLLIALFFMSLGALIMALTPMKRHISGFMTTTDRTAVVDALAQIDSMRMVMASNQTYIDNVVTLMDTEREPTDSASMGALLTALPMDSLKTAGPVEKKFVAMMDEREKYNLNVLTPVAADAVTFVDPADGGIVLSESQKSDLLKVIVPMGQGVNAIADGKVIDRTFDAGAGTYSLIIQSKRGFLTRYSHLGTPLVEKGDAVLAGQRITLAPARKTPRTKFVGIEMWREGTPIHPGDYLYRPKAWQIQADDITAPRGR